MNPNNSIFIKEKITNTLLHEAGALSMMSAHITEQMCLAVQCIHDCPGRLIITGIGKSAIIAQKIVSTLNSTGTPSIFMHAADAIHGDLGMIGADDIVLCISKSGETPELKVLVPLIRNFGNKIMAIVNNEASFLAKQADYTFLLPFMDEADPNILAPTTSTTLQIAMGDAIAVSLIGLRGFDNEHFAKFHPGGSLGKQMYLRVSDLVGLHDKPRVYLYNMLREVILEISSKRLGATAVLDDNENLKGIITDGDLRRMLEVHTDLGSFSAADIMNHHPKTIQTSMLAIDALALMRKHSITQLIVLDGNRYKGLIHLHDILKEGII